MDATEKLIRSRWTMDADEIKAGYVETSDGLILVQLPASWSRWGFVLADDDQTWEGGFGIASMWKILDENDPRITDDDRERLGWLLDEYL